MTPEEKAKNIIDKYENVDDCDKHYNDRYSPCSHQAKQCAIISVEQIIEVLGSAGVYEFSDPTVLDFYQKVLKQLTDNQ
jgi:hypothetical protein